MKIVDLVQTTASDEYLDFGIFLEALISSPEEIQSLLGAGIGMSGEVGEFNEILKKHVFQQKEFNRDHAIKELGDIMWYFGLACIALKISPEEVEEIVSAKLLARYSATEGRFNKEQSENRKENDV